MDADALSGFLVGAGLEIKEQCGDWDRSPLGPASPEIIHDLSVSLESQPPA